MFRIMKQMKVLLADDQALLRSALRLWLEQQPFIQVVEEATELSSLLAKIEATLPDILLLDLMLPDIDGWEIYRQLKTDEELSQLPVIIVSARNQDQDAAAGFKVVGDDKYVQKPFGINELLEAVENVLPNSPTK